MDGDAGKMIMWENILSEEQKTALAENCPEISWSAIEYLKPGSTRERGEYKTYGIMYAEELVRSGISANDIKEGLRSYASWVSYKHLNAATEMADIAYANLRF